MRMDAGEVRGGVAGVTFASSRVDARFLGCDRDGCATSRLSGLFVTWKG